MQHFTGNELFTIVILAITLAILIGYVTNLIKEAVIAYVERDKPRIIQPVAESKDESDDDLEGDDPCSDDDL